jgi:hypothetical protein
MLIFYQPFDKAIGKGLPGNLGIAENLNDDLFQFCAFFLGHDSPPIVITVGTPCARVIDRGI